MLKRSLLALSFIATTSISHASVINGDFQTCDATGWQTDSATLGNPGYDTDFAVVDDGTGNCAFQVGIDLATTQEFIANTLFTDIDLSVSDGFGLNLSFDWQFEGEEAGEPLDGRDNWFAAFGDGTGDLFDANGQLGSLFGTTEYGSGTFSADLAPALFNTSGWTLEFQLLAGFDVNFLGSQLSIDNVNLTQFELDDNTIAVSAPSLLGIFGIGLFGLGATLRRKAR